MADAESPVEETAVAEEAKPKDESPTDMPTEEGEGEGEGAETAPPPRVALEFIFDDEKKKRKSQKVVKGPPVKRPSKAEYERTIADLNGILADLNRKVAKLDEINFKSNTKLVEMHEEHHEVSQHLKRVMAKHARTITVEEEYNVEIIRKNAQLKLESQTKIKNLENKYNATQTQLQREIDMLSTKLSTLRVFSEARDEMLHELSNMEAEYKQSDQRQLDRFYAIQQKAVVERNDLNKEAKQRFERITGDFNDWREVRNAAYTRRLLSENSALRRKYNKLIPLNIRKERELIRLLEKTSYVKETYALVNDITQQLESTQSKRNDLLEKLQKFSRFYSLQVILGSKYRRLEEAIKKAEMKEDQKYGNGEVLYEDLKANSDILLDKLRELKEAENEYYRVRQYYEYFMNGVKRAIYSLCDQPKYSAYFPQSFNEYKAKRGIIIKGLIELITSCERHLTTKSLQKAKYYRGYLGFIPHDAVICQIFKCKNCGATENLKIVPSFCLKLSDWQVFENEQKKEDKDDYSEPGLMCLK